LAPGMISLSNLHCILSCLAHYYKGTITVYPGISGLHMFWFGFEFKNIDHDA
jgi:hypothetical protein